MKKILIGFIAMGSLSAFAAKDCSVDILIQGDIPLSSLSSATVAAEQVLFAKGYSVFGTDKNTGYDLKIDTVSFDGARFATAELLNNQTNSIVESSVIKDPIGPFGIQVKQTWSKTVESVISKLPKCK